MSARDTKMDRPPLSLDYLLELQFLYTQHRNRSRRTTTQGRQAYRKRAPLKKKAARPIRLQVEAGDDFKVRSPAVPPGQLSPGEA